jgi:hypothetical protein
MVNFAFSPLESCTTPRRNRQSRKSLLSESALHGRILTFVPALDDATDADLGLERLSAIDRRVELGPGRTGGRQSRRNPVRAARFRKESKSKGVPVGKLPGVVDRHCHVNPGLSYFEKTS